MECGDKQPILLPGFLTGWRINNWLRIRVVRWQFAQSFGLAGV
jgi:hypothetical protein